MYIKPSSTIIDYLEYEEKHSSLKSNKETLLVHFRNLKHEMNKKRESDRQILTKLTLESDAALKPGFEISEK